ncbi:lactococcin 972 family bacteriocin [Micrococcaceae bacterium Sec5.7]
MNTKDGTQMNVKKVMAGVALTGALVTAGAGAANAWTQWPVEGGTWNYGYNAGVYSDYINSTCHGSSVYTDWGNSISVNTPPDKWANAWHTGNTWTHNSWYYRTC